MSLEHGGQLGVEVRKENNEITSLRRAKEAASQLKEKSLNSLVKVVLKERFGLNELEEGSFLATNLRQGKGISIEKREIGKDEWKPVTSNDDLVEHLEKTLNQKSNPTQEPENYLGGYVEDVACGVQQVKQQYIDHQLNLIGDNSKHSREELDKHTAVDLEGGIKFKKINSKGKVFNYSVKSGKSFRYDAEAVLETKSRVPVSEKDLDGGVNSDLAAFLTGASVVLLNEFVIHGDHKTLQALAIAGSAIGYLSALVADKAEKAFVGTRIETVAKKFKKLATGVFYGSMGIAGAEVATNLAHGVVYQAEQGERVGVEAHMNNVPNVDVHQIEHLPSYNPPEQQAYGAEVSDAQIQKPTLEVLSQTDPRHTTELQLNAQVKKIVGDTNWVNQENGVTKADVITQWTQRLWGHNKGEPLTKEQIDAMKMVNESTSFLDFMRIRPLINKFIASNVN